jgi:hypothetical protein
MHIRFFHSLRAVGHRHNQGIPYSRGRQRLILGGPPREGKRALLRRRSGAERTQIDLSACLRTKDSIRLLRVLDPSGTG